MSLVLLEGYSSGEEEDITDKDAAVSFNISSSGTDEEEEEEEEEEGDDALSNHFTLPPPSTSALPSVFDAFSEISGPPEFLNNCADEATSSSDVFRVNGRRSGRRKNSTEASLLPSGAVVEAKAQLVGIRERVRSDVPIGTPFDLSKTEPMVGSKRVCIAMNPSAEDAAELLRMCVQCGIPKTFSSERGGMVCPECGDRVKDKKKEEKKSGGGPNIKDKERSKRMKGQSSHSTWKSETEMQLRQHFD